MIRHVVVEASSAAFELALREAERDGHHVVRSWRGDASSVCAGVVEDAEDAARALLAAVSGAAVVVHAQAPRDVVDRLVDDLRRLGPVDHRLDEPDFARRLSAEEEALLTLLSDGLPLGEAARRLHVSRRTADRRLAAAKRKLGATTTAEALVRFRSQ